MPLARERNRGAAAPGEAATGAKLKSAALPAKSRLWVWFLLAFVVQISAWTAWITIASHHQVQDVPLQVAPGAR